MSLGLDIFLLVVFLILHAFFSLAETAILNVRKSRLREIMEDDDEENEPLRHKAAVVLELKQHPERFIATVQTGQVFAGFLAAAMSAMIAYDYLSDWVVASFEVSAYTAIAISVAVMLFAVTILDLTFGALIPKSIALHRSEAVSMALGSLVNLLSKLFKPLTHLPVLISNLILRPFKDHTSFTESRISEEEFRVMLEEGAKSGVIDKTENELIENIFDFRERTAREIMVPRTKVVALDVSLPHEVVIERIIQEGYTRLPVYQDSIDNIVGVIYSKDVLALIEHPVLIHLTDIIRPAPVVPETKLIAELLREFQKSKLHMAVVVDEFGGTAGIITLEDIIEEIVGEIHDEYDDEPLTVESSDEGKRAILSASFAIADANEHLEQLFPGFHIPDDEEYESVSGYVNKLFGYIPETGEYRDSHGVRVRVLKRSPNRVVQVEFEPAPIATTASQSETA